MSDMQLLDWLRFSGAPPLFPLGRIVATSAVVALGDAVPVFDLLRRHASGDWGDVCPEDRRENRLSLAQGFRLMSVYELASAEPPGILKVWIITEADRSSTCVLLPEDY